MKMLKQKPKIMKSPLIKNLNELLEIQEDVSEGDINAIIAGKMVPNNQILETTLNDTKVSKEFLEGNETTDHQNKIIKKGLYETSIDSPKPVQVHEDSTCMYYSALGEFIHVPLYEDIYVAAEAAGVSADGEYTPRYIAFRRDWLKRMKINTEKLALIHFKGESMMPTLQNDDIILIDKTRTEIRPERIVVIKCNQMVYIKRIQSIENGFLMTKSDNPLFENIAMDLADEKNKIIGQIVWFGRTLC